MRSRKKDRREERRRKDKMVLLGLLLLLLSVVAFGMYLASRGVHRHRRQIHKDPISFFHREIEQGRKPT